MTRPLKDFVLSVRNCDTKAQERDIISKESAAIRTALKDPTDKLKHRNLVKGLFIHLMGYPAHFIKSDAVKALASPRFFEKRIGYLVLSVLLGQNDDMLTLIPNSINNDLESGNNFVVALGLTGLSTIGNADMYRTLLPQLEKSLQHQHTFIRKKACLAAVRGIRLDPSFAEIFVPHISGLLSERSHAVVISATSLLETIYNVSPDMILPNSKNYVQLTARALRALLITSSSGQHDIAGITDPFLQVRLLRVLRLLCINPHQHVPQYTEIVNDVLAQVISICGASTTKFANSPNAVLYECVHTILTISTDPPLRSHALNSMMRFFTNKNNNARYVSLSLLGRIVDLDRSVVQKHRSSIINCLGDSDESIRRRAISVVSDMMDKDTLPDTFSTLLMHVSRSDSSTKREMTEAVCQICERHSPTLRWMIDAVMQILSIAGQQVPETTTSSLISTILAAPSSQHFAAQRLCTYLLILRSARAHALVKKREDPSCRFKLADDSYSLTLFTTGTTGSFSEANSTSFASLFSKSAEMGQDEFPLDLPPYFCKNGQPGVHPLLSLAAMKGVPVLESDEPILRVCVWAVGEFSEYIVTPPGTEENGVYVMEDGTEQFVPVTGSDLVDVLSALLPASIDQHTLASNHLLSEIILALAKVMSRPFADASLVSRTRSIIEPFQRHMNMFVQEVSCESNNIADQSSMLGALLKKMPPLVAKEEGRPVNMLLNRHDQSWLKSDDSDDEDEPQEMPTQTLPKTEETAEGDLLNLTALLGATTQPTQQSFADQLASILSGGAQPTAPTTQAPQMDPTEALISSIMGSSSSTPASHTPLPSNSGSTSTFQPLSSTVGPRLTQPLSLGVKGGIAIQIECQYPSFDPSNPASRSRVSCRFLFTNTTDSTISNFVLKTSGPTYLQRQNLPPSGDTLFPNSGNTIAQAVRFINTTEMQHPTIFKARIEFQRDGQAVIEDFDVNELPV
ncbi:Adaptor protein complex 1 (AP-1), gamma subunit [Blattamonas nauphoetae]|uniref:AP-1 complex subunit gamma n=1 Tax=Blattamonas nauphoetae TaxID=2049346 RepID=A0ABQ9XXM1_9EUKA|nr:Adaptor protein complex 1 (AP-1), gamma subunit [Blattamonas nauphoetae]